ncbi:hypothetical protein [Streptomyces sp. IBSBF 2950]|uniref:hypothetical protein n=1 Tax=Streptomyces sp. IBSBF 2950 TaxID=2903528 RepID=UPI002FDC6860
MKAAVAGTVGVVFALSPFFIALMDRRRRRRAARAWQARARLTRARTMPDEEMGDEPLVRVAEALVYLAWRKLGQHRP